MKRGRDVASLGEVPRITRSYLAEKVTVWLEAARPFRALVGVDNLAAQAAGARFVTKHTLTTRKGTSVPFDVIFAGREGDPALTATWFSDRSVMPRPFPTRRFLASYARERLHSAASLVTTRAMSMVTNVWLTK